MIAWCAGGTPRLESRPRLPTSRSFTMRMYRFLSLGTREGHAWLEVATHISLSWYMPQYLSRSGRRMTNGITEPDEAMNSFSPFLPHSLHPPNSVPTLNHKKILKHQFVICTNFKTKDLFSIHQSLSAVKIVTHEMVGLKPKYVPPMSV